MKKFKLISWLLCIAFIGCKGQGTDVKTLNISDRKSFEERQKVDLSKKTVEPNFLDSNFNFRSAAKKATSGVVHITSTYSNEAQLEFLRQLEDDFWLKF